MQYTIQLDEDTRIEVAAAIITQLEREGEGDFVLGVGTKPSWIAAPPPPGLENALPIKRPEQYALVRDIIDPETLKLYKERVREAISQIGADLFPCIPKSVVVEHKGGRNQAKVIERETGIPYLQAGYPDYQPRRSHR